MTSTSNLEFYCNTSLVYRYAHINNTGYNDYKATPYYVEIDVTGPRKTTLIAQICYDKNYKLADFSHLLIFFHNNTIQLESLLYTCVKILGLKTLSNGQASSLKTSQVGRWLWDGLGEGGYGPSPGSPHDRGKLSENLNKLMQYVTDPKTLLQVVVKQQGNLDDNGKPPPERTSAISDMNNRFRC